MSNLINTERERERDLRRELRQGNSSLKIQFISGFLLSPTWPLHIHEALMSRITVPTPTPSFSGLADRKLLLQFQDTRPKFRLLVMQRKTHNILIKSPEKEEIIKSGRGGHG